MRKGTQRPDPDRDRFTLPTDAKARARWQFRPYTAKEMLASKAATEPTRWIWNRFISENSLNVHVAYMKVGKSTFTYELALRIARGEPFLGYPTQPCRVLILAVEEHERDAIQRLIHKLGLRTGDPVRLWPAAVEPWMLDGPDSPIRQYVEQHRIGLVILDTLATYWAQEGVQLDNEGDNIKAARIVSRDFLTLARQNTVGAAVLLNHHESKAGGHGGRGMRGASSPFGLVEQQLQLRHLKGHRDTERLLQTTGRYDVTPKRLLLGYVPNGLPSYKSAGVWVTPKHYVRVGASTDTDTTPTTATREEKVLAALRASGPATATHLAKRTRIARTQLDPLLRALRKKGIVTRKGSGRRGHPYQWSLAKKNGKGRA